ncbi:MAG: sulfotransferase [Daejeonella sp.]|uniref:sulfotransferase n=1 Tax=Daejeonella sp. TaxID=2805397 RepID=UPI0027323DB4|nr:sulfotransferase [Daejeonella sp.]MDP3469727.1 sulfotransferase [Daejeonella sp.]
MSDLGYSFSSRLLHRIALQSKIIAEISFDIENMIFSKKGHNFTENPIFISGLARSGTTMLMRYLYQTGEFRSLTYQDMPFVLMPNLWKKLSFVKASGELKERAHRDGILVSFESPEAFEEVFWRVFSGDQYIANDRLKLLKTNNEVLNKFRDFVRNALLSSDKPDQLRYLSKNNNNILRLNYLKKSFPAAKIVIPFREPLQHALSLLNQHTHFSGIQKEDKFSLDYMNWLGHFEFGLNQKPFDLNHDDIFKLMENTPKSELDFWLLSWKNYYSFALENTEENHLFFCYEDFCNSPAGVLQKLFPLLGLNAKTEGIKPFNPSEKSVSGYSESLHRECVELYNKLKFRFNSWYQGI